MPRVCLYLLLIIGTSAAAAQNQSGLSPASVDPDKLAKAVRDSYYHPDTLSALECNVSFDWSGILHALQIDDLDPARAKIVDGLKVHSRAARNQATEVILNWTGGDPPENKERVESAIRQMVSGFYQIYWQMMASPSLPVDASFSRVEPLDEGNVKAYVTQAVGSTEMTVDKDGVPIHYSMQNPSMNGTMDAHYTPSPKPVAGDLRRLTELDVTQQRGDATMRVEAILDYQQVSEFYVPQHVTFNVVGMFSVGMDFSGCSATKGAPADEGMPKIRVH